MKAQAVKSRSKVTKMMARVAIFGAIASILYLLPKIIPSTLPFLPGFLEFHFDEIPAFIAGFAYGPLTAFLVILVKTIIKLPFTGTATVGEFADLLYSTAFVIPAAIIYQTHRTFKGALAGLGIGFVSQLIVSSLANMFFMIDFYLFLYNMTPEFLLTWAQVANKNITDIYFTMVLYGVLPFNVMKDILVIGVTLLVYKRVHILISKKQ